MSVSLFVDLRRALLADQRARAMIAREAKIHPVQLSNFVNHNSGLGVEHCERLAEVLGYEINLQPRTFEAKVRPASAARGSRPATKAEVDRKMSQR